MTGTEVLNPESKPLPETNVEDTKVDAKDEANVTASPKKETPPKPRVHKKDFEKDTVYLFQFPRLPTIPSVSPLCLAVETFLRFTGIQYENVDYTIKNKSKNGQIPFVELNGEEISDSDKIIKELSAKFGKDLNEGLTDQQRLNSHAFESMLINHTAWVVRWWRYNHIDEFIAASKLDIKRGLNSSLPTAVLNMVFKWNFKRNMSAAIGHGIGQYSPTEALGKGKDDLESLSKLLANQDYFFGDKIHLLDIVAFAHLAQFVFVPFEGINEWMKENTPNLIALVNRIKEQYWPDWDEICESLQINTHLPKKELTPEQIEEQKKAEEKRAEEEKKKEQKKKEKEEKKRQKDAEQQKKKEEKERKKKETEEAKAKAKAEAKAKAAAESAKATEVAPDAEKKDEEAPAKEEPAKETEASDKKE